MGIGFVEFETRRRFRASGVIKEPVTEKGFSVEIREAFSVCPKYIQRRTIDALHRFPKEPRVLSSDPSDPSLPCAFRKDKPPQHAKLIFSLCSYSAADRLYRARRYVHDRYDDREPPGRRLTSRRSSRIH